MKQPALYMILSIRARAKEITDSVDKLNVLDIEENVPAVIEHEYNDMVDETNKLDDDFYNDERLYNDIFERIRNMENTEIDIIVTEDNGIYRIDDVEDLNGTGKYEVVLDEVYDDLVQDEMETYTIEKVD